MRRVTRSAASSAVAFGLLLAVTPAALAGDGWGNVHCGQDGNPSCELGAGRGGGSKPPPQGPPDRPAAPRPGPGQEPPTGDSIIGGDDTSAHCSYVRSGYQPPTNGVQTVMHRTASVVRSGQPQPGGGWYVYRCTGPGFRDGLYRAPIWLPDGVAPAEAALPSPQELAEQARARLRLPAPSIEANPAGDKLVNLPTWLWLDRGSWGARQATAAVPGVSVMAVATPQSVSWAMGDGGTVSCQGPGTPFTTGGDASAASPDCGHTYRRSSAAAPDQRFSVSATIHWTVTWSGAGASGTFPDMTTSAAAAFRVAEIQALGTGRR